MRIIEIPQVDTNLFELLDIQSPICHTVIMQAATANTVNIEFGLAGDTQLFIDPGKSSSFPVSTIKALTVNTSAAGQLLGVVVERF